MTAHRDRQRELAVFEVKWFRQLPKSEGEAAQQLVRDGMVPELLALARCFLAELDDLHACTVCHGGSCGACTPTPSKKAPFR